MKISNFTGSKLGLLGAAILGTSILLSGCKKDYTVKELLEKVELASNEGNVEELLKILNHRFDYSFEGRNVKEKVLEALGEIKPGAIVLPELVKILTNRDEDVRNRAQDAIDKIKKTE